MRKEFTPGNKAVNIRSPLSGWLGGKWLLSKKIVPLLPAHNLYCEPFLGAGWVLLRKPKSHFEVANDINCDLVNCWQVIQNNPEALLEKLACSLISRKLFSDYRDMSEAEIAQLSPEENAWRLLYLLKNCFGRRGVLNVTRGEIGKAKGRPSFCVLICCDYKHSRMMPIQLLREYLMPAHERVKEVCFENLPWQKMLKLYDRASAFFYIDPPFMGCEKDYGSHFRNDDFREMAELLSRIKGNFLLSLNDCEEAKNIFSAYRVYSTPVMYSVSTGGSSYHKELFITSYPLDESLCKKYEVERLE